MVFGSVDHPLLKRAGTISGYVSGNGIIMRSVRQYYRVDRHRISLIKFIFEAYEGVAVVTTIDAASGEIVLSVAPGCETIASDVMTDLGRGFKIERGALPDRTRVMDHL